MTGPDRQVKWRPSQTTRCWRGRTGRIAGRGIGHRTGQAAAAGRTRRGGGQGLRRAGIIGPAALLLFATVVVARPDGAGAAAAFRESWHSQLPGGRLSAATAAALSRDVTDPVIIVLKDQQAAAAPGSPADVARQRRYADDQAPLLAELRQTAAAKVHAYRLVNAVSATVSRGEAAWLSADPAVREVIPDVMIPIPSAAPVGGTRGAAVRGRSKPVPPGACPARGQPAMFGEDLQLIHDAPAYPGQPSARSLGFTGAGVKVAFLADGLDIDNPDFIRPDGQHVIVTYKDFAGDGTNAPTQGGEAFEDASAIASQGKVYNVSHYGATSLDRPCRIRVEGVAPGASLVALKILAQNHYATPLSAVLQAIDYAVEVAHVQVLNESDGPYNNVPDVQAVDVLDQFDNAAVAAGTTVTVATGDAGIGNTFDGTGTDPRVIGAGASTAYRWDAETSNDGYQPPFAVKGWLSDNISTLSSSGYGEDGLTNDLVAPGDLSIAACTPNVKMYADCASYANRPAQIEWSGGTSEAAPLTAGTAALVIQAYRHTHRGASPTPAQIKQIILSTTDDLGHPADEQGSGILDVYRAVLAAESAPGNGVTPRRGGDQFLLSKTSFNAIAMPGTAQNWPLRITSVGHGTEHLALGTRTLGPALDTQDRTVTLTGKGPHFINEYGQKQNYAITTFRVAPGRARLEANIAYKGSTAPARIPPPPLYGNPAAVDVILIDPQGNYAADGFPQGVGNADHVQVRDPASGTWKAVIFSDTSAEGGTTGPVRLGVQTFDNQPMGSVTPSHLTLAPGHSATVMVHMRTPDTAGDADVSVTIAGAFGQATSVPVTLHSLIDLATGGTFRGVLIGGNGRQPDIGQTAYYHFDVPAHPGPAATLNATLRLADRQTDPAFAYLIDPAGDTVAATTNALVTRFSAGKPAERPASSLSLSALAPAPGRWTLIISFAPTITGHRLATPYSGRVWVGGSQAAAPALPRGQALTTGKPVVIPVTVHNPGPAAEDYFADPRLDTATNLPLAPQTHASVTLPMPATAASPSWLVPTGTTALSLSAESATAVTFDFGQAWGDPDLGAAPAGDTATGSYAAAPVAPGDWFADPAELGPFGAAPPPSEPSSMRATAATQAFNPAITSATGDLWTQSVNPSARPGVFTIGAGQTAVIDITITPSGPAGRVITGHLYIDQLAELPAPAVNAENFSPGQAYLPTGNQVAALPYKYRAG